jgi:cytochrome bd-type quinol oxidase subunit 2
MMNISKNRTMSQIAAKVSSRLFIVLLAMGVLPIWFNPAWKARLDESYLYIPQQWTLIFPVLLLLMFVTLYISAATRKFQHTEYNALLTLNSIILIVYLLLLYKRLYPMIAAAMPEQVWLNTLEQTRFIA